MTVYEVCYSDAPQGDGFGRMYFTSKAAAKKAAADLVREHRRATAARLAAENDPKVDYYDWPASPGEHPEPKINDLTFTGSPKQMVLDALRYRS